MESTQYCTYHIEKGEGNGGALGHHIDRTEGKNWAYRGADPERIHLNQDFSPEKFTGKLLGQCVEERIKEGYQGKKAIRKDAVRYINHMLTGSHERMVEIASSPQELEAWVQANRQFVEQEFGAENIVRFTLHLDEKTPHIHCITVPLTADGRLSAKERMGNPEELSAKQDRYAQAMKRFGLERGIKGSKIKHETTQQYNGRISAVEQDKEQLVQAVQQIIDKQKIHPLNIKEAKEAIRSDLSDLVAKTAVTLGQALIAENKALKSQIRAIETKSRYASIAGAAHALKERLPILSYFTQLVSRGLLRYEGRKGQEHYFASGEQKTGSISVNEAKGLYFNHAEGSGGDLIKAAQVFEKKGFTDAVMTLSGSIENIEASLEGWNHANTQASGRSLQADGQQAEVTTIFNQVQHPALVNYIKSRGIAPDVAKSLKEIHWNVGDRRYFGVAMPTLNNGFVVRSPVFAGNLEAGGISVVQVGKEPAAVKVFEGLFDYLTYRTLMPKQQFQAIILNSVANLTENTLDFIRKTGLKTELYLDNDAAGKKATEKALQALPGAVDLSPKYAQFKDLNEAHISRLKAGQEQKKGDLRKG